MNEPKKAVLKFLKTYQTSKISVKGLKDAIQKQGFTVIEFRNSENSDDVNTLIREFGLAGYIKTSKGFTYADRNYRLVFVNEELSDHEKLIVLSHEEGHIFQDHFREAPVIGRDVIQEYEANEFAHYLLNPDFAIKIRRGKKYILAAVGAIAAAVMIILCVNAIKTEQSYYGDFYITSTGGKYHKADCVFVKNKDNVHRMTKEEFDSGSYEPCGMCLPENKPNE